MARFLNEHGVTSNDLSFFRERRAVGQRWLGVDYYPTCEHRIVVHRARDRDALDGDGLPRSSRRSTTIATAFRSSTARRTA